jgi:hypothetical protein
MRVLVTGGRDFQTVGFLRRVMDGLHTLHPITLLIHGGARGVDTIVGDRAESRGVPVLAFPVPFDEWVKSKRAGNRRNFKMLTEGKPDLVVAFPGGTGTSHMVNLAKDRGVKLFLVPSSFSKGEKND